MYKIEAAGVSEGIGIGRAVIVKALEFDVSKRPARTAEEKTRFNEAVARLTSDLEERISAASEEQAEILESHVILLADPFIISEVENIIEAENCNCEHAAARVLDTYIEMFLASGDELLMMRSSDLGDIKSNLLAILTGTKPFDPGALEPDSILVAEDITTSVAAGISAETVSGIITRMGGQTSHTAIIARGMGIPAVAGAPIEGIQDGAALIVDGSSGKVIVNPDTAEFECYQAEREKLKERKRALEQYRGMPSVTVDGREIELCANIGLVADIVNAVNADAEGVGLFRTEFLYMNRNMSPGEDEQFSIYKKAAVAFGKKPVIIRTLDVGGDKKIPYLGLDKEENPFLGWRAIRYCLDRDDIFRTQLRAILRASAYGEIRIMLPMISTLPEFKRSRELIDDVKAELREKGEAFNEEIQIGIMIETPAAAIIADKLAQYVDFFSIGTNDLTQYTIAVDRGNKRVAGLYSAYNPAVLRLIHNVAREAEKAGIICGVCGEAGGDPLMVSFLIGCGIGELSMSAGSILQARQIVRNASYGKLREAVDNGLYEAGDTEEATAFLESLRG